ncbi:MAG: NFACT family protein, partial [Candidatus Micrarchaeota archaeon]|nr:NFACT family protein [Candidatus Micrarchaeota archaeon]
SPSASVESIKSEKGRLMAVLAKRIQIGSVYLEEACARAGLAPNKNADSLGEKEIAELAASIGQVVSENSPLVYYSKEAEGGRPTEYSLCSLSKFETADFEKKKFETLSSALDEFAGEPANAAAGDKRKEETDKLKRKLEEQEKKVIEFELESDGAKAAGDAIYANYEKVDGVLAAIRNLRKSGAGWDEVRGKTGAKIDEKKGKAKMELR